MATLPLVLEGLVWSGLVWGGLHPTRNVLHPRYQSLVLRPATSHDEPLLDRHQPCAPSRSFHESSATCATIRELKTTTHPDALSFTLDQVLSNLDRPTQIVGDVLGNKPVLEEPSRPRACECSTVQSPQAGRREGSVSQRSDPWKRSSTLNHTIRTAPSNSSSGCIPRQSRAMLSTVACPPRGLGVDMIKLKALERHP